MGKVKYINVIKNKIRNEYFVGGKDRFSKF